MPVTKSAAKRARQSLKRHQRNLKLKTVMRRDIKALVTAIAENDLKSVGEKLSKAHSSIDKAVKTNLIHKNKAARQKAKLVKLAKEKPAPKTASKRAASKTATKTPAKKTDA